MLKSPTQFIEAAGVENVAAATGRTEAAVRVWKTRNVLPREAWLELSVAYPELTLDVLRKMEKKFPRRRASAETQGAAA